MVLYILGKHHSDWWWAVLIYFNLGMGDQEESMMSHQKKYRSISDDCSILPWCYIYLGNIIQTGGERSWFIWASGWVIRSRLWHTSIIFYILGKHHFDCLNLFHPGILDRDEWCHSKNILVLTAFEQKKKSRRYNFNIYICEHLYCTPPVPWWVLVYFPDLFQKKNGKLKGVSNTAPRKYTYDIY